MKKLYTLVFAALAATAFKVDAQLVTISATHQIPAPGDTLHYLNANSFGFDPTGTGPVTNKIWDNSLLMNAGTFYDFYYLDMLTVPTGFGKDSFPTATLARGESGASGYFYYQNTASNIDRVGWYLNTTNYGIYENGTKATEFQFPVTAGNTFSSSYHGRYASFGVGEDSVKIESGAVTINADMQGTLLLPTGTFTNVLRLHVVESFHIKAYIIGIPATDDVLTDDYFYWFTDTILQPILISGTTDLNGSNQSTVLRYRPIVTSTGIADLSDAPSGIYPNPSNGKFFVRHHGIASDFTAEIYNALGEKMHSSMETGNNGSLIDISGSPKGVYFVKITSGNNTRTEKLVIQ